MELLAQLDRLVCSEIANKADHISYRSPGLCSYSLILGKDF